MLKIIATKGTMNEQDREAHRLRYELIETYREIALLENGTGGIGNLSILRSSSNGYF